MSTVTDGTAARREACSACGHPVSPRGRFCGGCGASLRPRRGGAGPATEPRTRWHVPAWLRGRAAAATVLVALAAAAVALLGRVGAVGEPPGGDAVRVPQPDGATAGDGRAETTSSVALTPAPEDDVSCAAPSCVRWRLRPADGGGMSRPALGDGVVHVTSPTHLVTVDAATGEVRWQHPVAGPSPVAPLPAGDAVVVAGPDGAVRAVEADSGEPRWTGPPAAADVGRPTDMARVRDVVMVSGPEGIAALDLQDGRLRWTQTRIGGVRLLLAGDGIAYAVDDDVGAVHALDPSRGGPIWSAGRSVTAAVVSGGRLVLVEEGTVTVRSVYDGARRWRHGPTVAGTPAVLPGERILAVERSGETVVLDRETGEILAGHRVGAHRTVADAPLVVRREHFVRQDALVRIDPDTGRTTAVAGGFGAGRARVVAAAGRDVVLVTDGEVLTALRLSPAVS